MSLPNKPMQTDGRFAAAADRQAVGRTMPPSPPSHKRADNVVLGVCVGASLFCYLCLVGVATFVVPHFKQMFRDMGTALPPITEFLLVFHESPVLCLGPPLVAVVGALLVGRTSKRWPKLVFGLGCVVVMFGVLPLLIVALCTPLVEVVGR